MNEKSENNAKNLTKQALDPETFNPLVNEGEFLGPNVARFGNGRMENLSCTCRMEGQPQRLNEKSKAE